MIIGEINMKIFLYTLLISLIITAPAISQDQPGTSLSRPNVSGGYDFYDSEGNKTGSSMKRYGGGYDYYDQYGNRVGTLKPETKKSSSKKGGYKKGGYEYYDADNIERGKLKSDPYGGYRYYEQDAAPVTSEQMGIRRDYKYADPYGSGIETLSTKTIQGEEEDQETAEIAIENQAASGLSTSSSAATSTSNTGLENTTSTNAGLATTAGDSSSGGLGTGSSSNSGLGTGF